MEGLGGERPAEGPGEDGLEDVAGGDVFFGLFYGGQVVVAAVFLLPPLPLRLHGLGDGGRLAQPEGEGGEAFGGGFVGGGGGGGAVDGGEVDESGGVGEVVEDDDGLADEVFAEDHVVGDGEAADALPGGGGFVGEVADGAAAEGRQAGQVGE